MFYKNCVLRNFAKFTGIHLCQVSLLIKLQTSACNFIKKETLAQVFSCEFCETFKNNSSHRTAPVAASRTTLQVTTSDHQLQHMMATGYKHRSMICMYTVSIEKHHFDFALPYHFRVLYFNNCCYLFFSFFIFKAKF